MIYTGYYHSELGLLEIEADEKAIHRVAFCDGAVHENINDVIEECIKQLDEYFLGVRKQFDLPLDPKGTRFQRRVWQSLCAIPYGETKTYKEIAIASGNEKASRAVGMANHVNPIVIIIPCHRVIGTNGKLVGYGGGLDKKIYLLELEKKYK